MERLPFFVYPSVLRAIMLLCSSGLLSIDVMAQAPEMRETFAIFARGGAGFSSYGSGFGIFRGPAECAPSNSGNASGFVGLAGIELPLSSGLFVGLGAGLTSMSGSSDVNSTFNSRDTSTGALTPVTLRTALETKMQYLAIQPELHLTLVPKALGGPLRLGVTGQVLLPMTTTFSQTESIVSPENAAFIAGGRRTQSRTIAAGDITTAQTLFSVGAAVENLIALSKSLYFTQQVGADVFLNKAVTDADWSVFTFRAELGLRYAFHQSPPQVAPPPPIPEKPREQPVVARELAPLLAITIKNVEAKGREGRELIASPSTVNAVFFGQNSAEIPAKYSREPLRETVVDPLKFHRHILPFLAKIMADNPQGTIEVQGATSGDDELAGLELAKQRAASVRQALIELGVPAARVTTTAALFPLVKSSQDAAEGREENRRADIIVRNAPLQEYVSRQNYAELSGEAKIEIRADDLGADSIITITSDCFAAPLTVYHTGTYTAALRCRSAGNAAYYSLQVEAKNKSLSAQDFSLVPLAGIQKNGEEVQIANFDAILRFDYNSDELSFENKELLRQMIDKLPDGSVITIYGSADALGTQQRNAQLEKNRAAVTEQFIRSISGSKFAIRTAQQTEKFPENTPEGRFLNRNMRIRLGKE